MRAGPSVRPAQSGRPKRRPALTSRTPSRAGETSDGQQQQDSSADRPRVRRRAQDRTAASGHQTEPPREVRAGVRVGGGHRCRPARRVLFLLHATCRPVGRRFGAGVVRKVGQGFSQVGAGFRLGCMSCRASGRARGWSGVAWAWSWWGAGVGSLVQHYHAAEQVFCLVCLFVLNGLIGLLLSCH